MHILVVSGHGLFRTAIARHIAALDPGYTVVEAGDVDNAVHTLARVPALDLVLLHEPGLGPAWHAAIDGLRGVDPDTRILLLGDSPDPATARQAICHGADGYLPGTETADIMPHVFALVAAGGCYVPPEILDCSDVARETAPAPHKGANGRLSPRRQQVLDQLAAGYSNKQIAHNLGLAEGTVKMHVLAVLRHLGAANRTQAVSRARSLGLIEA